MDSMDFVLWILTNGERCVSTITDTEFGFYPKWDRKPAEGLELEFSVGNGTGAGTRWRWRDGAERDNWGDSGHSTPSELDSGHEGG